jgi:hypothetical protein
MSRQRHERAEQRVRRGVGAVGARAPKRWLAGWIAVALLAAWQGALLHPLEHRDARGALVHLAGADHGRDDGADSDARCDAIAAVATCIGGGPSAAVFAVSVSGSLPEQPAGGACAAPLLAYRSQAPPALS